MIISLFIEIRDHPFFTKDFSRSSQSNNYKFTAVMYIKLRFLFYA